MNERFSLQKLADMGHRKLKNSKCWDKGTYDAVLWLRQNRDQFKEEIIEPPCLSLSIKDKPFTGAVEACVNATQLKVRGFSAVILAFEVAEAYASRCLSLRIRKIMTNSIISPTTRGDKSSRRWRNLYLVLHITGTNRGAAYDSQGGLVWFISISVNVS